MKRPDPPPPRRGRSSVRASRGRVTPSPSPAPERRHTRSNPDLPLNPGAGGTMANRGGGAVGLGAVGGGGGGQNNEGNDEQPLPEPGPEATDEEVLAWAASLGVANIRSLTAAQLMRMVDAMCDLDFSEDYFVELATLVQYQGFNPAITARTIWLAKKERGVSNDQFKNDISLICVVFLTRGTNIVSMTNRMSDEGKARVNGLVQTYSLKKGQVNADELTLSRVALTFYPITVQAARVVSDMLPVTPAEMHAISPGYPAAMMTQAFTSAIPVGKTYELDLAQAHCLFLIEFSKVINPAQREKGDAMVLDSFLTAFKAAYSSRRPERNARHIRLLQRVGVLTTPAAGIAEAPMQAVMDAAASFRAKFGNIRF
uniref:Nucleoprotein n=1 Tax=Kharabali tick phlebovirus TaxID=2789409 RepID=A0A7S8IUE8_9VIRU|nr:nucleoprotein [Kharabali tick phlebovirus]